ncbi:MULTISPECIES: hypothetical protein [unclassified Sphingomonas]|nr:hypothetical protein [Sphingomonas sp. FARSPH]
MGIEGSGQASQSAAVTNGSPSHARPGIAEALQAVYEAFASAPPPTIDGCPCCISTRGTDVLLTTPLRQIPGLALWRYVSGAFLTVGDTRDFRYLLPRILEVSVCDPGNANDPEIVLGKLALADWRSWSQQEQRVIEDLVDAWFEQTLANDLAEAAEGWLMGEVEHILCGAARAGMSLRPWLVRLSEADAAPVLAYLEEQFPTDMSPFWEFAPHGLQELTTILTVGRA